VCFLVFGIKEAGREFTVSSVIMQAFAAFEFFTTWFIGAIAMFFVVLKSALHNAVSLSFLKNLGQAHNP